ncbi:unnamed protein product [Haemonchus placei]|uniref:PHD-type domain-containing protein n=1 Tax=Haemonchus placei TaxID=6290 RepID=A0A158QLA2_HAEPC|nr:unnamed protein product [Haemonchus placei]
MVVEEFRVRLCGVEEELVSNPEKWFLKIPEKISNSFVTALEADQCPRTRARNAKSQKGYRLQKLVTSLLRSDKRLSSLFDFDDFHYGLFGGKMLSQKALMNMPNSAQLEMGDRQPPLCIFCFDNGSDTNELCGRLRWCPDIPLFFAIHELCALMTPEVLTVDNPTPLGKELFETDVNQLHAAFARGRTLICSVCHEKGAGIGCCSTSCRRVFHLPCAIRSMCYLDYEEFRCFCSKHSAAAFEKTTASLFSLDLKKESEDLCCLCMDKVQPKINLHSVIQMDCCGLRFYHFACMQHASLVRGQEMRCPACNRPNEETCFEERLKRQGIYLQT